jgi:hypothetical protein
VDFVYVDVSISVLKLQAPLKHLQTEPVQPFQHIRFQLHTTMKPPVATRWQGLAAR